MIASLPAENATSPAVFSCGRRMNHRLPLLSSRGARWSKSRCSSSVSSAALLVSSLSSAAGPIASPPVIAPRRRPSGSTISRLAVPSALPAASTICLEAGSWAIPRHRIEAPWNRRNSRFSGAVADLEHVVQRVVRAARDVAEARVEGASAAAAGAPERRARHHAAAVVVGLRGLPAVELAAALRALHRLLHERRLHGAQAALRIGAGELAFGDEPGRQRVLPSGGLPHSRIT